MTGIPEAIAESMSLFNTSGIARGNQDAGGLLPEHVAEFLLLGLGVEGVGPRDFGANPQLPCGSDQAGGGVLPVGDLHVGDDQEIPLFRGCAAMSRS